MNYSGADTAITWAIDRLKLWGEEVDTGHWQGVPTEGKPDLVTREILNLQLEFPIPVSGIKSAAQIQPNMPWAEDHFQERVGRVPSNPGEQYKNWPWWRGQDEEAMIRRYPVPPRSQTEADMMRSGEIQPQALFTHTYQERFWPGYAGRDRYGRNRGIRYPYGDLDDVVDLLRREPHTRQAYLPIFFPEDTGAVHRGRIPCTLGYHFLLRGSQLHCWYHIRSCDAVRHFRDDLYMACRLVHWVLDELRDKESYDEGHAHLWDNVDPGTMHFTAYSFHVHMGDIHLL